MKPFLLFDFDGTIADSIQLGWKIANLLAPKFGHKPFTMEDFYRFRSLPVHTVLKELKIPFYKIPMAISKALVEYRHLAQDLEPCQGIVPMLDTLKSEGFSLALLSSNTGENLNMFLQRMQIDAFDWVEGTSGILKKNHRIMQQLKKHSLDPKQVIYIGDETRDIDAAHKCGLKIIAVTWGFHTADLLRSHNPEFLVDTPEQIVQIVRKQTFETV
ncbi:MAG: HAD-IA family hydrolase [Candidatus Cloacimonetes bacterium]|nr:HAD-IA family hydrolase [Candidatus Cloacimonadota bacterium]